MGRRVCCCLPVNPRGVQRLGLGRLAGPSTAGAGAVGEGVDAAHHGGGLDVMEGDRAEVAAGGFGGVCCADPTCEPLYLPLPPMSSMGGCLSLYLLVLKQPSPTPPPVAERGAAEQLQGMGVSSVAGKLGWLAKAAAGQTLTPWEGGPLRPK